MCAYRTSARQGKRKVNVLDVNRMPVTPTVNKSGWQTRKEILDGYAAEEKAKLDAPRLAKVAEATQNLEKVTTLAKEVAAEVRTFWAQPLTSMKRDDVVTDSPTLAGFTMRTSRQLSAEEAAFIRDQFYGGLADRNVNLSKDGIERLDRFFGTQVGTGGIEISQENWEACLRRMLTLSIFAQGEVSGPGVVEFETKPGPKPAQSEAPAPAPSIDGLSTEHREQRQECLKIVGAQWGNEVQNFYGQWAASMKTCWGLDVMTEDMARRVGAYFVRWNLSPLRHASYDQARRAFSKQGLLGDGDYRTESEKLSDLIEDADLSNRDVRADLNFRTKQLRDN